jgi:hypothetical protein
VVYLPTNTDDYSGTFMNSPGQSTIPASLAPWSSYDEKKFVTPLLDVLNKNLLAGRDTEPNLDNLLPDIKDTLGSVPLDTPVVLFCLDNSCFMGLNEDGSMNPISKCVEGDDIYHVKGALVVAPDRSLRHPLDQKKRISKRATLLQVYVLKRTDTHFGEPDFLSTLLAYEAAISHPENPASGSDH